MDSSLDKQSRLPAFLQNKLPMGWVLDIGDGLIGGYLGLTIPMAYELLKARDFWRQPHAPGWLIRLTAPSLLCFLRPIFNNATWIFS